MFIKISDGKEIDIMRYIKQLFYYIFSSINTCLFFLNKHNIKKNTVLVISNGMSMSGAPLVLQDVISYFVKRGYEPLLLFEHTGKLINYVQCKAKCCFFFEKIIQNLAMKYHYDYVFVNTIACYRWIRYLEKRNYKYNFWIHEGEEYFSKYHSYIPKELKSSKVFYVSKISYDCLKKYHIKCDRTFLPYKYNQVIDDKPYSFDKQKIVLLVGSICKRKNQMEMLAAIERLEHDGVRDVRFIFVGSPIERKYGNEFKIKASRLKSVEYIEYLEHDKMIELYKKVFLCVCTSTDDPLPVTITEAIFSKRMVLVSSETGQYSLLSDKLNMCTYNLHNISELTKKIKLALNTDYNDYLKISNLAYELTYNFFSEVGFNASLNKNLIKS